MEWIKNNAISIIAALVALGGSYTNFQLSNAELIRDVKDLQEEMQEMDEEFENMLYEDDQRIQALIIRMAIVEEKLSKVVN